ncbi:MAG: ABC transporter permease [Erysipelotrichaceae bacterium]|jgi:oligopeptide transport system permease protein|nr:ABC transporter permease [Erysipelotrichaceae bacterium]MBQ1809557.1 ABC transporter permease [Erysipelotrichaceae bacterium]MBQ5755635.1 ABC transporter permease [Erysipelotrichaceae bacterium]MCR5299456.1 ABC transporter permease [Erysipelotrichaceae bacterium]
MSLISDHEFHHDDFAFAHSKDEKLIDKNFKSTSYLKDVWGNFKKNKGALVGAVIIMIIILFALIGPSMNEHTYKSIAHGHECLTPRIPVVEKLGFFNGTYKGRDVYAEKGASDVYYWFGTDTQGRDIFTRVWSGTRVSLVIAFAAVLVDIFIGMVYGMVSGFIGGRVDMILQRIAEILNGIPTLVVVTLLGIVLKPGISSIIFALVLTGWIGMERIARAQVLKVKEQEYILASTTLGASKARLIFKEVLPNIFGQVIITSMFSIPSAIFLEAYLSFLGLGVPAPLASLGSLVSDGYKSMTTFPHILIIPVVVLGILMLCFNLFADGLRDAFDPKMLNK